MSFNLWKFFIDEDVDNFRQYLARATYIHGSSKNAAASSAGSTFKIGSPSTLATSPRTPTKGRKSAVNLQSSGVGRTTGAVLTRADINARDGLGRTILHHASSSSSAVAVDFVKALLDIPTIDLYVQDAENGWTALHRALYAGNIEIAQALLQRDTLNVTDFSSSSRSQLGGLVKIKDHEGNSPFEVLRLTTAPRILADPSAAYQLDSAEDEDNNSNDGRDDLSEAEKSSKQVRPVVDLRADEVFTFGSNKNLSLGLGDEDDRQFPERVHLERPEHLLQRLRDDHIARRLRESPHDDVSASIPYLHQVDALPAVVKFRPINIQNVIMAKLHTAVLTDDPISNLHICGFGPGGRLGTGDESTRFNYVCIQGGGLATRRVSYIALGQDHSVAICSSGEVFTWGSNKFGQLGYILPEVSSGEIPVQLTPRQLYGLVKKETIIGAAASSIHSVIYTASSLYTFGKNEGQLGLMDADARSLISQDIPRRVGVSVLQSPIKSVSAIDRATVVLLESRDVIVFTHYGFTKVVFPLEESNIYLSQAFPTSYSKEGNLISKTTSGGNTIAALSTFGQVFTIDVPKPLESVPSNVSTTNPNKARNALPQPNRVWSIKKSHMSAIDVAVGQAGSIILCTKAGSVWRKEKRANIKSVHIKATDQGRSKDYKFVRVPYLTRAIAVRSNAFGAFAVVQKDWDVTHEQIFVDPPLLWQNLFPLMAFHTYGFTTGDSSSETELRFWLPSTKAPSPAIIKNAILRRASAEADFARLSTQFEPLSETQYDVWITSNATEVRIPVHSTVLGARSRVLRSALATLHETYYFSIPDTLSVEYGDRGEVEILLQGADFLTLVNFVFYLYTDNVIDVWRHTSKALHLAPRYRQVRLELMKIASHLELRQLEGAVRKMIDPVRTLAMDIEAAFMDLDFYSQSDVAVDLADGAERPAHSVILSARCPFFEGLFHGRAAGRWLTSRRGAADSAEQTHIDLKHVDAHIFDMVQRHIYADTAEELFDNVVSRDVDDFIDTIIEVMSVANELMLDRLTQICQYTIGRLVTTRNVCGLLNTIAESSVEEFKNAALEYVCLNLEGMLEQRQLGELEHYLLQELDDVVQDNQLAYMPFVRSGRAQTELLERYPNLPEQLEQSRQKRLDSMRLPSRLVEENERPTPRTKSGSYEKLGSSPGMSRREEPHPTNSKSPKSSLAVQSRGSVEDLPFDMDEDSTLQLSTSHGNDTSPSLQPVRDANQFEKGTSIAGSTRSHDYVPANSVGTDQFRSEANFGNQASNPPLSDLRVDGFDLNKSAWRNPAYHGHRADLKEIMEQASTLRVSSLTQAMKAAESPRTPVQKMSQKERKRQQQQQQQQLTKVQSDGLQEASIGSGTTQTPWTKILPPNKLDLRSTVVGTPPESDMPKPKSRPNMNTGQIADSVATATGDAPPKQSRSTSNPAMNQDIKATSPQIQSIRHTPLSTRSASVVDAHTSMADILAQQQGEKFAIREAAARRSLQEIQQEQEFQEWWDQESKRVQEEEETRTSVASAARKEKPSRGRGGRRRGSGRGSASTISEDRGKKTPKQQGFTPGSTENQSIPKPVEGRKHGQNRGRGRGKS